MKNKARVETQQDCSHKENTHREHNAKSNGGKVLGAYCVSFAQKSTFFADQEGLGIRLPIMNKRVFNSFIWELEPDLAQ